MAIKIISNNIYEIKNNKIIDNVIDEIKTKTYSLTSPPIKNVAYNFSIYNKEINPDGERTWTLARQVDAPADAQVDAPNISIGSQEISDKGIINYYFSPVKIILPLNNINIFDIQNLRNVFITAFNKIEKHSTRWYLDNYGGLTSYTEVGDITLGISLHYLDADNYYNFVHQSKYTHLWQDENTLGLYCIKIVDNKLEIYLSLLDKYTYDNLREDNTGNTIFDYGISSTVSIYLPTLKEEYTDTIIGSGENILNINSNILFTEPVAVHRAKYLLKQWKNGKETAVIDCNIADYYDEEGNLAISPNTGDLPMIFNIGDIVIPYTVNKFGEVPLSTRFENGQNIPKKFIVVGSKIISDGSTIQQLTLQEFIEN